MKKIYWILSIVMISILFSCDRENVDGKWDDNIKLSAKEITFDKYKHSFTINTQSTNWWLNEISLNNNNVDLSSIDKLSKNFKLTKSDFEVERKDDGKTIIVLMNENSTNSERLLKIGIQQGNYFDGIKITQKN